MNDPGGVGFERLPAVVAVEESEVDPRGSRWLFAVLAVLLLAVIVPTLRLGIQKEYTIDEFQYAHAAWLVAQGDVPYRDFFEVHNPLVYQLLAPVFLIGGDDPELIGVLRVAMLVLLGVVCWALVRINSADRELALLAPALLLAMLPFIERATEIRTDAAAFTAFIVCLAWLAPGARAAPRPLLAGVAFGLALWGSQKVLWYGSPIAAAWIVDVTWLRRAGRRCLLVDPWRFAAGAGAVLATAGVWLLSVGALDDWWRWCIRWAYQLQRDLDTMPWTDFVGPVLRDVWWIAALAVGGVAMTLRRLARSVDDGGHIDHLLLMTTVASFVAVVVQKAPYTYNLIPFLGLMALFAGRGAASGVRKGLADAGTFPRFAVVASGFLVVLLLLQGQMAVTDRLDGNNRYQHRVLAAIGTLTDPSDAVYDNSGSFVTRPHTGFLYYTCQSMRGDDSYALAERVPEAIRAAGTVMVVRDARFDTLPDPLKRFLATHFQPYSGELWLWGQRFEPEGRGATVSFESVRDDEYFIEPAHLVHAGRVRVDGHRLTDPVVWLSRGPHEVTVDTDEPFEVLWLPADGQRWTPRRDARPHFSVIL